MKRNEDKRNIADRREKNGDLSEKFVKYFIPEDQEKRSGKDRRKKRY